MTETEAPFHWPSTYKAAASLSFDDARPSQLDIGVPLFDRYDIKASFYVLPERLDARIDSWRAAAANGHETGSHTLTHPCTGNFEFSKDNALESYTEEQMIRELQGSKSHIGQMIGTTPRTFAYPCGQTFIGRGRQATSYVPLVADRYLAGRLWLSEDSNNPAFCDLAQILAVEIDGLSYDGMKQLVDRAVSENRWLIFAGHDIGAGGRQTAIVSELEKLCHYLKASDETIWVDTIANIADYIRSERQDEGEISR
jgi:peptidoglycan/xylan/chitin deacetylase (PgdA/CDA1 family)